MLFDSQKDMILKKALVEICKGFSIFLYNNKTLFLKHRTLEDDVATNNSYETYYVESEKNGIWKESKRLAYLKEKGLWDQSREDSIEKGYKTIKRYQDIKVKKTFQKEIEQYEKLIEMQLQALYPLEMERQSLLGMTCESCARDKANQDAIINSIFKDNEFKEKYLEDNGDSLTDFESIKIKENYYKIINKFSRDKIKEIALLPAFSENYYLCLDNASLFFGKPIYELTNYQSELGNYGLYFKRIFENHEVPSEIDRNPNAIIDHVRKTNNLKKQQSKSKKPAASNQKTAYLNTSESELKDLGFNTSNPEEDLLKSSGKKKLNFQDLIKLENSKKL
jgi:hypothetical protein